MTRWRERVDDLLYDGETIEETIDFEEASVVVTSHRVLAFDSRSDGPTLQQADRPNVESVSTSAKSEADLLQRGVKTGVIGVVLVVAGLVVDFQSIVGDVNLDGKAVQKTGAGDILGLVNSMLNFIKQLDYLMRVFGALMLFLGVVFLGVYWFTRDPTLVIEVGGNDDIHVTRPADASEVAERIERAVRPDAPEPSGESGPAGDPLGEA